MRAWPQFDIDPMQLPEGMDEELALLDELGLAQGAAGGGGGAAAAGASTRAGTATAAGGRRGAKGRALRLAALRSLGDVDVGGDDGGEEEEEAQGDGEEGPAAPQPPQQQQRVWGQGLMRKYSLDDFQAAFPDKGGPAGSGRGGAGSGSQ